MRKIAIVSIGFLLIALSCAGYVFNAKLPDLARKQTLLTLTDIGFEHAILTESETRIGAARFKNIALDPENFSTIKIYHIIYGGYR